MRGRGSFQLRQRGETAAVQQDTAGLGDRRDLARRREAADLVQLDAEHVRCPGFHMRQRIVNRKQPFIGHQRNAFQCAANLRHSLQVAPLDGLLHVPERILVHQAHGADRVRDRPAGVGVDTDDHVIAHFAAHGAEVLDVLPPTPFAGSLQAQNLDAELVDRPACLRLHHADVVRQADRPFQRDGFLAQAADQLVDRQLQCLAQRIMQCHVDHRARGGISR